MRRAPVEANAACLDAALQSLLVFIEHCDTVARVRPMVLAGVIEKGLGAARVSTRTRALEIILELVAGDSAEPIFVCRLACPLFPLLSWHHRRPSWGHLSATSSPN